MRRTIYSALLRSSSSLFFATASTLTRSSISFTASRVSSCKYFSSSIPPIKHPQILTTEANYLDQLRKHYRRLCVVDFDEKVMVSNDVAEVIRALAEEIPLVLQSQKAYLPEIATTLIDLANTCYQQPSHRRLKALCYEAALLCDQYHKGQWDVDLLEQLASIYGSLGDKASLDKAIRYANDAVSTLLYEDEIIPHSLNRISEAYRALALLYHQAGNTISATATLNELYLLAKQRLGTEHPDMQTILRDVQNYNTGLSISSNFPSP